MLVNLSPFGYLFCRVWCISWNWDKVVPPKLRTSRIASACSLRWRGSLLIFNGIKQRSWPPCNYRGATDTSKGRFID